MSLSHRGRNDRQWRKARAKLMASAIPRRPKVRVQAREKSELDYLLGLKKEEEQVLTKEQAEQLLELKYPEGGKILHLGAPDLFMEGLNVIREYGFKTAKAYYSKVKSPQQAFWASGTLERIAQDVERKLAYVQAEPMVMSGIAICSRCGSGNVLVVLKQIRSGDEGATGFYTCQNCKNRWREG